MKSSLRDRAGSDHTSPEEDSYLTYGTHCKVKMQEPSFKNDQEF